MHRKSVISFVLSVWLLPLVAWGQTTIATVYDFASDFSPTENPHGTWTVGTFNHTYSGKSDELMNLTAYGKLTFTKTTTSCGSGDLRGWGKFSAGFFGAGASASGVVKNTGASTSYSIPRGSIGIFPQYGPVVVRWTAPKTGKINIRAKFANLTYTTDDGGFPEVWVLLKEGVSSPLHYEKAYLGTGKPRTTGKGVDHLNARVWASGLKTIYQSSVPVAAKDTIDFVVDPMYSVCEGHSEHADGNGTDIIGLTATIRYDTDGVAAK